MNSAIEEYDFTVLCGFRGQAEQDKAVKLGNSKTPWPTSKHNQTPSLAVDIAPFPIDWNNIARFRELYNVVMAHAEKLGVKLRAGADFNQNGVIGDDRFIDWPHYELTEVKS